MHSCTPYSPGVAFEGGALKISHGGIDLARAMLDLVAYSANTWVSWNCASITGVCLYGSCFWSFGIGC